MNCSKKILVGLIIIVLTAISAFAKDSRDCIIADRVAVFYPADFDSTANMPSFALVKELPAIGNVPSVWDMNPVFYHSGNRTCFSLPVKKGTSLYGTGEVTGKLLRNNTDITIWNTDNYNYLSHDGKRLYQSHPWVLGVNPDGSSFGVISDNTWKQELVLDDSIRLISDGPASRVIVIERDSPQEVLEELSDLTGKEELPPLWSLGYHQCRYTYSPDSRAKEVADEFRKRHIPCDVIWFDIDYMDKYKVFTFDKNKFPNPSGLNKYLHDRNFKSIWMIDPGVKLEDGYSVYESGNINDVWVKDKNGNDFIGKVWPGECKFPDFTQPKTRKWWAELYYDFMHTGIDGVWNDMNEPSVFETEDHTMPIDNMHLGGGLIPAGHHLRYHNVYGMLMIKSSREGIMKVNPEKRPFILSRSGYLGSYRYGATWTGDNMSSMEHLKLSVPMSLNLGLSGQYFSGPDIGGFAKNATPELFGQWIALGAFYPFSRGHASNDVNNKEPWAFGPEIENVSRIALNRRYRLLPYIYTTFQKASSTGIPVMQPVFFADIKDTTLRREEQSFLFGSDLMIIPKWAKNPAMPKGNWKVISITGEDSRNDKYQPDVLIREGAIVPSGKAIECTAGYSTDSLTLFVSVDKRGNAEGRLYEDSGDGFGYKEGQYAISVFSATTKGRKVTIRVRRESGFLDLKPKVYKIILMTDKGKAESKWLSGNKLVVKK